MAMIYCSECGERISDKTSKCIHCGKILREEEPIIEEKKCQKCGTKVEDTDHVCANCGCPLGEMETRESVQQAVNSGDNGKPKKKTIVIAVAVVIILVLLGTAGGVGYKIYNEKQAEKAY